MDLCLIIRIDYIINKQDVIKYDNVLYLQIIEMTLRISTAEQKICIFVFCSDLTSSFLAMQ